MTAPGPSLPLPTEVTGRRRVVRKEASDATEAARILREAEILRAACHPGLVELVSVDTDELWPVVRTAEVAGQRLDALTLTAREVAGVVAALATTLADLHDLGLVHGAVAPEHVLIDEAGRPLLCGFGSGGHVGEVPVGRGGVSPRFVDPAFGADDGLSPAIDVYGLGACVADLIGEAAGRAGEALRSLATTATHADPDERPSARSLAARIYEDVSDACLPRGRPAEEGRTRAAVPPTGAAGDGHGSRALDHWRRDAPAPGRSRATGPRSRALALTVTTLAVAAAALAAVLVVGGGRGGTAAPAVPPAAAGGLAPGPGQPDAPAAPTTEAAVGRADATVAELSGGPPGCEPAESLLVADIDGDGCSEALFYAGGLVTSARSAFDLAESGALLAVGDWTCSGRRTLALLRPSSGEVFRFDGWAGPGADAVAPLVGRVEGAVALRVADVDRNGCHELVVDRTGGPAAVFRAAPAR